jgi:chemotaxis protein methyltransferase CheR
MAFTYFFRDLQTLELIITHVLPTLQGHTYIKVWDAGCAHGPEPYSIAILFREHMSHFMFRNVKIYATDIDTSHRFGEIIAEGVYPEGEVERIPPEIREKYFRKNGQDCYEISAEIKSCLEFARHDLLSLKPAARDLHLIVCKNVLLHLKPGEQVDVIKMYHEVLVPGGFFITEQTQKLPDNVAGLFERIVGHAQLFRKVE